MKRRTIFVAGMLLVVFALGVLVGSRHGQRPLVNPSTPPAGGSVAPSGEGINAPAAPTWGGTGSCVDINDASSQMGKTGCVSGQVLRIFTSRGGNTFLDFCQDYRSCPFTSVIFAADKDKFGNLESLRGRKVEIRGDIKNYRNRAEIIIHDPHQITNAR